MRFQPGIDALDVEGMATLGEQAKCLVLPELAEAHRAVGAVDQSIASPVLAHRNLIDQGLVEPARRGDVPCLVAAGLAKAVLELAVVRTVAAEPPAEGVEAAAVLGDDGVVADEEEGAGEDADDGDHEGGEGRAGAVVGDLQGGRRWENHVAPLGAVDAAEALSAVFSWLVGNPGLLVVDDGHGQLASPRAEAHRVIGSTIRIFVSFRAK